jgi:dihydrofolate reductase
MDVLLLGRKTYDIFAGFWAHLNDDAAGGIAGQFNRIPKYVASRVTPNLDWVGSSQLGSDIAAARREVRNRHQNIHVIGSLDFVQMIFTERLLDRLNVMIHPIVFGDGKNVFSNGAVPSNLTLAEPAFTSPNGIEVLRYELADGVTATGNVGAVDRGVDSAG